MSSDSHSTSIVYQPAEGAAMVIAIDDANAWFSVEDLARGFDKGRNTITRHAKEIVESGELARDSIDTENVSVAADGKARAAHRYSFKMLCAIGYRVSGPKGIRFRTEVTKLIEAHMASRAPAISTTTPNDVMMVLAQRTVAIESEVARQAAVNAQALANVDVRMTEMEHRILRTVATQRPAQRRSAQAANNQSELVHMPPRVESAGKPASLRQVNFLRALRAGAHLEPLLIERESTLTSREASEMIGAVLRR